MEKSNFQRMIFLFLAAFLLLIAAAWQPKVYGNDEASIRRYIHQTTGIWMQSQGDLLAVEDRNDDRIVIFRPDDKKPDEVWFVRFRRNEDGNYVGYAPERPRTMYEGHLGDGIWRHSIDGYRDDHVTYYFVWSENPKLSEIVFRLKHGDEQRAQITENPTLTVFEFETYGSWGCSVFFYDTEGNEL